MTYDRPTNEHFPHSRLPNIVEIMWDTRDRWYSLILVNLYVDSSLEKAGDFPWYYTCLLAYLLAVHVTPFEEADYVHNCAARRRGRFEKIRGMFFRDKGRRKGGEERGRRRVGSRFLVIDCLREEDDVTKFLLLV